MRVLIMIELLAQARAQDYQQLTRLMQEDLGWETQITGANGVVAPLANAIYAGETDLRLVDLADNLLKQITTDLWRDGARVVIVQCLEWAGAGTA